jgi:hypothetical protein
MRPQLDRPLGPEAPCPQRLKPDPLCALTARLKARPFKAGHIISKAAINSVRRWRDSHLPGSPSLSRAPASFTPCRAYGPDLAHSANQVFKPQLVRRSKPNEPTLGKGGQGWGTLEIYCSELTDGMRSTSSLPAGKASLSWRATGCIN